MEDISIGFGKKNFFGKSDNVFLDNYKVLKQLGRGSYGIVYEVRNKNTGEIRACKRLSKLNIRNLDKFEREINILIKADHPNIIKLYEIFESQRYLYLIMEECKGGDIFNRINENIQNKKMYTEKDAANIILEVMSSIEYCHNHGICHRDLKPENLLYLNAGDEKDNPIKLIDFGLSQIFTNKNLKSKVGTAYYVAPEILKGDYTELCDIWSAGVILYILLSGDPPFNGSKDETIYKKIKKMKFSFPDEKWKNISKEAKDLISHMLVPEKERFSARQVIEHPWFKKASSTLLVDFNFDSAFVSDNILGSKFNNNLILTFSIKSSPFTSLLVEYQSINLNKSYKLNHSLEDFQNKSIFFSKYNSLNDILVLFNKLLDDKNVKVEETNKNFIVSNDLSKDGIFDFNLVINNDIKNNNKINKDLSESFSLNSDNINLNLSNSAQDIVIIIKNIEKNKFTNSLLRLHFLKKISNYLINNNIIKNVFSENILNLVDQINNFVEEDSIKSESKKTYDIIHFSNYLDKKIRDLNLNFDNFTSLLRSILKDEQKNEIDQYVKTLNLYDEYNNFFEPQIIYDLQNCFFNYSLVSCKYVEGENLEAYKKRKMSCNNMNRKLLYHEDEELKNVENIYFFDSIDNAIIHSKKNNGKIIENNENFSLVASEVFYDERKLKQFEKDIPYDELNKKESDGIFSIKIKRDNKKEVNDIFGNKYIISQKYQILPIYKLSLKRNEYYVLHIDPELKKKKEYLKKLNSIQNDQNLLNMNIYFKYSIEEALKFILKRRYNKVILICSIGKDKSGIRFVEIARKILFNFDVLVLFFSEDEKLIPEIEKFKNCLYANKLDLYKEYILNYNYDGLINLKKKLEDLYNITFQQFSFDFLSFTNAQNIGEFNSLESFRSNYFREVYIKNKDNYIYMDNKGKTQITKKIDKRKLWFVTLSEDNEITFFSNGFYLDISKDSCNTEGNYKSMIKWKFEKKSNEFYNFIYKKNENNLLSIEGKEIKVNKGDNGNNKFELIDEFEVDYNINSSSLSDNI